MLTNAKKVFILFVVAVGNVKGNHGKLGNIYMATTKKIQAVS